MTIHMTRQRRCALLVAGLLAWLLVATWPALAKTQLITPGGTPADPCRDTVEAVVIINQTANTQLITGATGTRVYICNLALVTASAQNVALVQGTGTICATDRTGLLGGASAATGFNLAANQSLVLGHGGFAVTQTTVNAANVCLLQSGSDQLSGIIGVQVR